MKKISTVHSIFEKLVQPLFEISTQIDKNLKKLNQQKIRIEKSYSPRSEFDRWRSSSEGQEWKNAQYVKQQGCCAICKVPIEYNGSHIDHIKPISKFPEEALETNNMQITCPPCNLGKGNSA